MKKVTPPKLKLLLLHYILTLRRLITTRSSVKEKDPLFSTQYKEILSILEVLEGTANGSAINTINTSLSGYFCSGTVFNLSRRVWTEMEINILEKGFDYTPIQNKINELKLKQDFEEFCHKMRIKWHFRIEPTPEFSTTYVFNLKYTWKPPNSSPSSEFCSSG